MPASPKPQWRSTNVQGLYEYRPAGLATAARGVYYSRYSVNGGRTSRSLETSNFEHAKIKHAKRMVDVEKDRQRGADLGSGFKTLGALCAEMEQRLAQTPVAKHTVVGRKNILARLRQHWQRGSFDSFLARNVKAEVVTELRDYLLTEAPWRYHFGKERKGFKPPVANQTLWALRVMLDIAVEKMVIMENPFSVSSVLRGSLFANGRSQRGRGSRGGREARMNIPSRPDMARILAEIRRVPENSGRFNPNPHQREYLQTMAHELADHAELLAFSGMRKNEAVRATVADDLGSEFKIWGTKSESSDRTIPVNPSLRAVLDRIKTRRIGPKTKLVLTREPGRALKRACQRLGLPELRNHDLRHFFASACIASGVDVPTVSRWLGHADGGALAMKTYGHLLKDASQAAAGRVDFSGSDAQSRIV
jgi:integrase